MFDKTKAAEVGVVGKPRVAGGACLAHPERPDRQPSRSDGSDVSYDAALRARSG